MEAGEVFLATTKVLQVAEETQCKNYFLRMLKAIFLGNVIQTQLCLGLLRSTIESNLMMEPTITSWCPWRWTERRAKLLSSPKLLRVPCKTIPAIMLRAQAFQQIRLCNRVRVIRGWEVPDSATRKIRFYKLQINLWEPKTQSRVSARSRFKNQSPGSHVTQVTILPKSILINLPSKFHNNEAL